MSLPRLSTFSYGPFYNQVDERGVPVLGGWLGPTDFQTHTLGKRLYTPGHGQGFIRGVGVRDGSIHFMMDPCPEGQPALLLPQDLDVLAALFFSNPDTPKWPSFKLDDAGVTDKKNRPMVKKLFLPAAIEHTDLGRTFFACTQVLEALLFTPEIFSIAPKGGFFDPDKYDAVVRIHETLKRLQQKTRINPATHHIVHKPKRILRETLKNYDYKGNLFDVFVKTHDIRCEIGVYTIDGTSPFSRAAATVKLTEYEEVLDELASAIRVIMPVYERLNQIFAICKTLNDLINLKAIDTKIINIARSDMNEIERAMINADPDALYCYRLPL